MAASKIRVLFLFLSLTACSSALGKPSAHHGSIGPDVWRSYQMHPDHNAVIPDALIPSYWTYTADDKINSGLALVGDQLLFDTMAGSVVSLDVKTGKRQWITRTDNVTMSTPVVDDGLVIIGTGRNGAIGAPKESFAYDPHVNDGPNDYWGRVEGDHILALDLRTGEKRWQYRTLGEDMPSADIVGTAVTFANGDEHAYGLRLRDGKPLWRADLDGVSTMASVNAADGVVLVSGCNLAEDRDETRGLNPATGALRWRAPYGNCDASPTIANGIAFLSGVETKRTDPFLGQGNVTAVDLRTGHVLWHFVDDAFGPFTEFASSERAIAGAFSDGTYFQAIPTSDSLVALRASDGQVKWRLRSAGPIKMSPVISHGQLYVGDTAGVFYDVDASNGQLLHTHMYDEAFSTGPPVVVGTTALIITGRSVRAVAL